jgi:GT2 family glycosyltransferase
MKVSAIVLIYNSKKFIKPVFDAIFAQTYKELEVLAVINGDTDGSEGLIRQNYPQVKILNPGRNLYFSAGNNLAIDNSSGDLILLVNHDLILEPTYTEELVKVFADPKVGAATGKLLRYDFVKNEKTKVIDTTGIVMSKSGRGRDRGQLQIDQGQFEKQEQVFGVSGAGPMYRRSALEAVKYCWPTPSDSPSRRGEKENSSPHEERQGEVKCEYFDEDFVAYWEDVDMSWRLNRAGFKNMYVPSAVAFHGRTAGQSRGGYLHFWNFIRHHQTISPYIRQLNYKNHILMYVKNNRFPHPAFLAREFVMFFYILIFEPTTLRIIPKLFTQIPRARKKGKEKSQHG